MSQSFFEYILHIERKRDNDLTNYIVWKVDVGTGDLLFIIGCDDGDDGVTYNGFET